MPAFNIVRSALEMPGSSTRWSCPLFSCIDVLSVVYMASGLAVGARTVYRTPPESRRLDMAKQCTAGGRQHLELDRDSHQARYTTVRRKTLALAVLLMAVLLCGCDDLIPHDTASLRRVSAPLGNHRLFAGLGTRFAAVPDLIAMINGLSAGFNPRMAAIMGASLLWVYYGLLITSRPVIA